MKLRKFYRAEFLTKNGQTANFTNILKCYEHLQEHGNGSTIYHGMPGMDMYRLKVASSYSAFVVALKRDNYNAVPFFWVLDGQTYQVTISKHLVK